MQQEAFAGHQDGDGKQLETDYPGGCSIPATGSLWEEPAPIGSHSNAGVGASSQPYLEVYFL